MTDKKADDNQPASAGGNAEGSTTIKFKHNGREIEVPMEQAQALVSKGYDYTSKMTDLKKQREELDGDRKALETGREFHKLAQSNPDLAQRIVKLANGEPDPSASSTPASTPALDTEAMTDFEKTVLAKTEALEQRLAQRDAELQRLSGDLHTRHQVEQQKDITDKIVAAAKATNFWDEGEIKEFVLPEVAAYMATHPDDSPDMAVLAKVADHKRMLERRQEQALAASNRGLEFRTQPANEGTPQATPSEFDGFKKEDLLTGKVGNKVFDLLKNVAELPRRL